VRRSTPSATQIVQNLSACAASGSSLSRAKLGSRACDWNLIGAACFFGFGKSDEGFNDFRAWLISQSRETFERVLSAPECLAEFEYQTSPSEEWRFEQWQLLPGKIAGEEDDDEMSFLFRGCQSVRFIRERGHERPRKLVLIRSTRHDAGLNDPVHRVRCEGSGKTSRAERSGLGTNGLHK